MPFIGFHAAAVLVVINGHDPSEELRISRMIASMGRGTDAIAPISGSNFLSIYPSSERNTIDRVIALRPKTGFLHGL